MNRLRSLPVARGSRRARRRTAGGRGQRSTVRRRMVAGRGRLPGLRAQLRRRERRRHRRPGRGAGAPAATCATSASTRSGSAPGTRRRWPTAATTSPTTARSTRRSARSREAEALIREALELGIRTIVDVVPNHVSDQHAWFRAALASPPGSPERGRFWFRPGRGPDGELPPNGWQSIFGGPAWTRTKDPDGVPGEWYLHLFAPEQPDLNWTHPDVWREHEDVLRFWFDRGVAGIRIDSAALLVKDPELAEQTGATRHRRAPVHRPRRAARRSTARWRAIADVVRRAARAGRRAVAAGRRAVRALPAPGRAAHGVQLRLPRLPVGARPRCARRSSPPSRPTRRSTRRRPGCWPTTTSPGRSPATAGPTRRSPSRPSARAPPPTSRSATGGPGRPRCWRWRCPGSMYIYQGEELGLPEVEDIPAERRQDPMYFRSGGATRAATAAGCRCRGRATQPPYGFSPEGASAPG